MNSRKILFISAYFDSSFTGGSVVSASNLIILKSIFLDVSVISLSHKLSDSNALRLKPPSGKLSTLINNLLFNSCRLTSKSTKDIMDFIINNNIDMVYLDSSTLGKIAKKIKLLKPNIKIIIFFHNIEIEFQAMRIKTMGYQYLISLISDWYNERLSTRFGDLLIALHRYDSEKLIKYYDKSADLIQPIVIIKNDLFLSKQSFKIHSEQKIQPVKRIFLFIGSAFKPNIDAMCFLSQFVAPYIGDNQIILIGKDIKQHVTNVKCKNISILENVSDLTPYYDSAFALLSPIFSGTGMKVKIAEALSYGLPVAATKCSLEGYPYESNTRIYTVCESATDYINYINDFDPINFSNKEQILGHFNENFSLNSAVNNLRKTIKILSIV